MFEQGFVGGTDDSNSLSPSFQHREKAAHHLAILFLGHRFGHQLVDLINKLCAMFNHLVHGTFLKEVPILIAILAIIEIRAAIGICAAIFFFVERHAATLAELRQLAFLKGFLLTGECCVIGFESLGMIIGHEIALGRTIGSLATAPIAGNQLLGKEIRHF